MVVVPGLAHGDVGHPLHIPPLDHRSDDLMLHGAPVVCEIANQPMPNHRDEHTHRNTPYHPWPPAQGRKHDGQGKLLKHPCPLHEKQHPIMEQAGLQAKHGRMLQAQLTVQLPPAVNPQPPPMAQVRVAVRLTLRPVSQVVRSHHSQGASHANQDPQVNQEILKPFRTCIAVVNELPMHSRECPRQSVRAVVTRNTATTSTETVSTPPTLATAK